LRNRTCSPSRRTRRVSAVGAAAAARGASRGASRGAAPAPWAARESYDFDQRLPEERRHGFGRGARVRHPELGLGTIRSCERTSAGHKVTVRFDCGSVMRLIAEFAGLVPA